MSGVLGNPMRRRRVSPNPPPRAPLEFHRTFPGYRPTPLHDTPRLAEDLGVGQVWVKDESARLGLPSFKILGASWAIHRALSERAGAGDGRSAAFADLPQLVDAGRVRALAAATDGNHGRAVARIARLLELSARIYVPAGTAQARIDAIAGEGAAVEVVDGTYGDAVARSAADESETCVVISDTSWPGYERIPTWVIEGYSTILLEVEDELASRAEPGPTVVVVQIGVGALAAAVVGHHRARASPPVTIGVEPAAAACVLESVRRGKLVTVSGPHPSIMAGLNCDTPSVVAWPTVSTGIDWFVAVDDEWARRGMRALAREGLVSGETGAAGVAGVLWLRDQASAYPGLVFDRDERLLFFSTEGATDPAAYTAIVGVPPAAVGKRREEEA